MPLSDDLMTSMIGGSAKSFDWREASPEVIGCEVGEITGKLIMPARSVFQCLWRPSSRADKVMAKYKEELALLFQFTAREVGFLDQRWTGARLRCSRWRNCEESLPAL
jgi:hypothetical protein